MKVIVVGFPKTGTKSMADALEKLGYKVYDILENFQYHGQQWDKLVNVGGDYKNFVEMYQDVDVILEAPAFYFWEEILRAFPDAKVILNLRDEDLWVASWKRQIDQDNKTTKLKIYGTLSPTGWYYHRFVVDFQRVIHGFHRSYWPWQKIVFNEMVQRRNYRQHNAYVQNKVPRDQLLVYSVCDGWEPLCKFLGKDIPKCSFPHKNKSASFYEDVMDSHPIMVKMKRETTMSVLLISCFATFLGYKLFTTLSGKIR